MSIHCAVRIQRIYLPEDLKFPSIRFHRRWSKLNSWAVKKGEALIEYDTYFDFRQHIEIGAVNINRLIGRFFFCFFWKKPVKIENWKLKNRPRIILLLSNRFFNFFRIISKKKNISSIKKLVKKRLKNLWKLQKSLKKSVKRVDEK